jgi:hypothetical protein
MSLADVALWNIIMTPGEGIIKKGARLFKNALGMKGNLDSDECEPEEEIN